MLRRSTALWSGGSTLLLTSSSMAIIARRSVSCCSSTNNEQKPPAATAGSGARRAHDENRSGRNADDDNRELLRCLRSSTASWGLSHQAPLVSFIHENPLSNFEELTFRQARTMLRALDGACVSPGEKAFLMFGIDPRKRVNEAMSEVAQLFLDLGSCHLAAPAPMRERGFLHFWAQHEGLGMAVWRLHARSVARRVLAVSVTSPALRAENAAAAAAVVDEQQIVDDDLALDILRENLYELGAEGREQFEILLLSMLREGVRGFAGMFLRLEHRPEEAPVGVRPRLVDFACVLSILMRSSISSLVRGIVHADLPLRRWLAIAPRKKNNEINNSNGNGTTLSTPLGVLIKELQETVALGKVDQQRRQRAGKEEGSTASSPSSSSHQDPPDGATPEIVLGQLMKLKELQDSPCFADTNFHHQPSNKNGSSNNNNNNSSESNSSQNGEQQQQQAKILHSFHESAIASIDQSGHRRVQLEQQFQAALIKAIKGTDAAKPRRRPRYAAVFCLDDRSGSLRRYIEAAEDGNSDKNGEGKSSSSLPSSSTTSVFTIDTYGAAGFFNVAMWSLPIDGRPKQRLAPAGVMPSPQHLAVESPRFPGLHDSQARRRRLLAQCRIAAEAASFVFPFSLLMTLVALPASLGRLILMGFHPLLLSTIRQRATAFLLTGTLLPPSSSSSSPSLSPSFSSTSVAASGRPQMLSSPAPGTVVVDSSEHAVVSQPFSVDEASDRLCTLFRIMGLVDETAFPSSICVVAGHGSSSVSNLLASAYNCGACSGKRGGTNARIFALMANDPAVRARLALPPFNIEIPSGTVFLGAEHDTSKDVVTFFEADVVEQLSTKHNGSTSSSSSDSDRLRLETFLHDFASLKATVDTALARNALERCHRFMLAADTVSSPEDALRHVATRAVDYAEPRPELNHSTAGACVIGPRSLTRGAFLDRRVFLLSYCPAQDDSSGTLLEKVLAPAILVTGGISLEYFMSTTSPELSAGSKAPLNPCSGALGLLQGSSSDLKTGLVAQMTEMHTPVRQLFVVHATVATIEAVLGRRRDLTRMVRNGWVRMMALDPHSGDFLLYREGSDGVYDKVPVDLKAAGTTATTATAAAKAPPSAAGSLPGKLPGEFVDFTQHREHALKVTRFEQLLYHAALAAIGVSFVAQATCFAATATSLALLTALATTVLTAPVLAFSRRFLHGDRFPRFAFLCVGLASSFHMIALAPPLSSATMIAWSLFGFTSFGVISFYSDRPSVRNNSTYAFAVYRVSDFALLFACARHHHLAAEAATAASAAAAVDPTVAFCLILAATMKSSQFPITAIFCRSMESPTVSSALAYGGLAAHAGLVLLCTTMDFWYCGPARVLLATLSGTTIVFASLVGLVRADRKGQLAYGAAASVGGLFFLLGTGLASVHTILLLAFGNAAWRIVTILQAPHHLAVLTELRAARGHQQPFCYRPTTSESSASSSSSFNNSSLVNKSFTAVYKAAHIMRRFDTDFHLMYYLHLVTARFAFVDPANISVLFANGSSSSSSNANQALLGAPRAARSSLTRTQQWLITAVVLSLCGFPLTPIGLWMDHTLEHLAVSDPTLCLVLMAVHLCFSLVAVRMLLWKLLDPSRVRGEQLLWWKKQKA